MALNDYFEGFSVRHLLLHPAVWLLVATAAMIIGATHLWDTHRYAIANPSLYTISRDNVSINEPPQWFANYLYDELYDQVFNSSTLLDQHVVPETASYLNRVPWIQNVESVNKDRTGLSIALQYRNPVAYVNNLDRFQKNVVSQTLVDSQGVVFDARLLTPMDASRLENDLLQISMPRVDLSGLQPWQVPADERVGHAARLCEYLSHNAEEMSLFRVVTFSLPSAKQRQGPELEIWTSNGVRILWGHSPGTLFKGEASEHEKIQALRTFIQHNGPLESFAAKGQQMIDVRKGLAQLTELRRYADSSFNPNDIK